MNRQLINAQQLASMSNLRMVFPDEPYILYFPLGLIFEPAAFLIVRRAALRDLVPGAPLRAFFSQSCSREDDCLKGGAPGSCSQRADESVFLSVLFSRRRLFEGQRSGFLFPARR